MTGHNTSCWLRDMCSPGAGQSGHHNVDCYPWKKKHRSYLAWSNLGYTSKPHLSDSSRGALPIGPVHDHGNTNKQSISVKCMAGGTTQESAFLHKVRPIPLLTLSLLHNIAWVKFSGEKTLGTPMGLRIPPLTIKVVLESNPLKSTKVSREMGRIVQIQVCV